ncbi:hypothetical protein AXE80_04785 [Wenyingzhuangia fucanilytica]|uniref:Peptidase MA-like domain-containing protein n=2 Tax=Wenyingzhuangia fucanilytica TaxID=1790137 RepID=A0A1B1Y4C8_9FLAO|nr:hypothetical protein AXE80_04785 [Wenyingzhuangia fucanilytica]
MKNKHLLILTFLFASINLNAQQFFGGHPLGQDWQILSSPAVRVIYPNGMNYQAQRIARITNYIDKNNRRSVGDKERQIDIVLQTQTTFSNGYVGLAPFRSEFYGTPPQSNLSLGSLNWLDVLSIHEYRHVLQNINAKNGIVNFFYYLGGESYWAVVNNLVLPNWYYEGDAVISETALSESGRGRNPFFTLQQRALINENINYSYLKNRNGSYKDLLPNHYPLGYMMLTYLRNHYGNDVVATILKESTSFNGLFYPFSKAIKRHTGIKNTTKLYQNAWEEFKEKNKTQLKNTNLIPTTPLFKNSPKTITTYSYPISLNDNTVIARKTSYNTTDELVRIIDGKETKITSIGINNDNFLSYNQNLLAWTESTRNPRRGAQNYSDIILFDLKTNQKQRLTQSTRYFSPSISPDGAQIATIHISPLEQFKLCILNAKTGKIIKTFDNPKNRFLSRTAWTLDGKNIISIVKENGKLCLIKINTKNGKTTELTPWIAHTIETPFVTKNRVYFNASFSGIDNIYSTDLQGSKQIRKETSVKVGAFQPSIYKNQLMFTEYSSKGFNISTQKLTTNNSFISFKEPNKMEQYNTIANQTEGGNILNKIDSTTTYKSKNYKGLFTGLKLHTWGIIPSLSVSSINLRAVNILNDLAINVSTEINHNENNRIIYGGNMVLSRYYPEITFSISQSNRQTVFENNINNQYDILNFDETKLGLKIGTPLTWYKGNYITNFEPYVEGNQFVLNNSKTVFNQKKFTAYHTGFSFSSIKRTAFQNIGPRGGFALNISKRASIVNNENANKLNLNSTLYLPGISKNHFLRIRGEYQKEKLSNPYQFSDYYNYPRGYNAPLNDEFTSISFNYGLPLAYPDFGFAGMAYFKRIKANLFYDYGVGKLNNENIKNEFKSQTYNSIGTEILFDNVYFNVLPISAGVRYSHLLKENLIGNSSGGFQFILATNLSF